MTEPTLTPKGRATRERLLRAAAEDLSADGRLEVAAVAQRAGVATSVLYRYFGSKDGLVSAVVDSFYADYEASVFAAEMLPEATWREREHERLRREVAFVHGHPLGRLVVAGLLHEPAAARADALHLQEHIAAAARNIRAGQRDGELPSGIDSELAAAAIIGALRAVLATALRRESPPAADAVADLVFEAGDAVLSGHPRPQGAGTAPASACARPRSQRSSTRPNFQ